MNIENPFWNPIPLSIRHKNTVSATPGEFFGVVDLFSGAGGMSYGFHAHPFFRIRGAADAEIAKPSMPRGALSCNGTYKKNMGIEPVNADLGSIDPLELRMKMGLSDEKITVLCACPPCTGFSRANPLNHIRDDHRNSLVVRVADFLRAFDADILVMENARELLSGNFRGHYDRLVMALEEVGYAVAASSHMLTRFGLPQIRERALLIAVRRPLKIRTLDELWLGMEVDPSATHVRRAFEAIPRKATLRDTYPRFSDPSVSRRLECTPHDGGAWTDLIRHPEAMNLLTDAMKKRIRAGKLGSHPDVYGRMWWDKPAPTIKRESAHIGNGRYAHPSENRLCSVREMATLQGFPFDFAFEGAAVSNLYRHIGDAVPPLVSHQLAWLCHWILTGVRPELSDILLPKTHLNPDDLRPTHERILAYA